MPGQPALFILIAGSHSAPPLFILKNGTLGPGWSADNYEPALRCGT